MAHGPAGHVLILVESGNQTVAATDLDVLTNGQLNVDQATVALASQRYRGRQQWIQPPVQPLVGDATNLELADLDVLTNGSLVVGQQTFAATYQRYRGRPQRAQWPAYSRLQATDLQLTDAAIPDLIPVVAPRTTYDRYKGRPVQAQWPVYGRLDVTGLQTTPIDLPDLTPPPLPSPALFRYKGRPQWQQGQVNDPSLLGNDIQIPDLIPWQQTTAAWQRYRGRQAWTQFLPLVGDATNLELADLDPLTNGAVGVDQVTLSAAFARYKGRPQWQQGPTKDPRLLDVNIDVPDLVPWSPPWATYQRYRGKPQQAQWPVQPRLNAVDLQLADQDITLLPSWVATTPTYQRYRGRQQQQQGLRLDPRLLDVATDIPDLIPWQVPWATFARYRGRPQHSQWPTYPRLNAVDLQLPDLVSPLLVRVDAPSTTYQRYRGRQAWFLQFFVDPSLGTIVVAPVDFLGRVIRYRRPATVELSRPHAYRYREPGSD